MVWLFALVAWAPTSYWLACLLLGSSGSLAFRFYILDYFFNMARFFPLAFLLDMASLLKVRL